MNKIGWTGETVNPGIHGCKEVSPACLNCYAAKMAHRLSAMGVYPEGITTKRVSGVHWTGRVLTDASRIKPAFAKLPKRKPTLVFVTSMADLFHPDVPDEFIGLVFDAMRDSIHTFQVLTKHTKRMADWSRRMTNGGYAYARTERHRHWWWPKNVWAGTTVEDQKRADERVPHLLRVPAEVRFLSCEPLLGPLDLTPWLNPEAACGRCEVDCPECPLHRAVVVDSDFDPIGGTHPCRVVHQVITGCESMGGKRPGRPTDIEWVRGLRDQCSEAGTAFFLKQLVVDGKVTAAPELDGRQWLQFPTTMARSEAA